MSEVIALVLAAGRSRRFGSDKRYAQFDDGRTLLCATLDSIIDHCREIIVVVRPDDHLHHLLGLWIDHPAVTCCVAEHAAEGMGASLVDGYRFLDTSGRLKDDTLDGVMIMLADMPYIEAKTLRQLTHNVDPARLRIPCFGDVEDETNWGHPVIFGRHWLSLLGELEGDKGGRKLLKQHPEACEYVSVDDPGVLKDIDRREEM
ncbi:nucleotidyltransferase family protein [Aurantivibrio plasticivorans]